MFNKTLDQGQAGDNVGCLLRGVKREDIQRGQVLAKPGSITPHTKFEAEVYVLSKEEGGRHTPFFSGYRPQFYFRTTDVTGSANLVGGAEMCMPGDNARLSVELIEADRHGRRRAVRHPRGWQDGGLGRRDEDPGVMQSEGAKERRSEECRIRRSDLRDSHLPPQGRSSIGRAPVSKTGGCEFDSRRPCH